MPEGPLFLEKPSYRRRRLVDGLRLLPFFGLIFWMVPLGWPTPSATSDAADPVMPMSVALTYLFSIWALLVLSCWLLGRWTTVRSSEPERNVDVDDAG